MPSLGLALGGGGARGLAHIHVLEALDELGVKPAHIAGSSIGAIMGAAFAAGMSGAEIRDYALTSFATKRLVLGRLWQTRPHSLADFMADGGPRLGQLNAERVLAGFLPESLPHAFEDLKIPLTVMATDFYAGRECAIDSGSLISALAASCALPAIFRPVRRDDRILIDGGIYNPVPFDLLMDRDDIVVAVDVNGGPEGDAGHVPTPVEAMLGASQLMMHSIIETKLRIRSPHLLFRPPVGRYKVMEFLRARTILAETAYLREDAKRRIARLMEIDLPEDAAAAMDQRQTA